MAFEIITLLAAGVIFVILLRRLPLTSVGRTEDFWQTGAGDKRVDKGKTTQEDSVESLLARAEEAFAQKNWVEAEDYYLRVAASKPDLPRVYNRLGIIYLERKNYKDARDAFLTTLKFDDQVASRHFNLAMAYSGMGNKRKAEAALKQAMSLHPHNDQYEKMLKKLTHSTSSGST